MPHCIGKLKCSVDKRSSLFTFQKCFTLCEVMLFTIFTISLLYLCVYMNIHIQNLCQCCIVFQMPYHLVHYSDLHFFTVCVDIVFNTDLDIHVKL